MITPAASGSCRLDTVTKGKTVSLFQNRQWSPLTRAALTEGIRMGRPIRDICRAAHGCMTSHKPVRCRSLSLSIGRVRRRLLAPEHGGGTMCRQHHLRTTPKAELTLARRHLARPISKEV